MSKWQEKTKRPVLPVYMAALVWPIMALLVPIYTLGGLVLTAAVSAGAYFAGTKLCPTRVVRTYVPYATGSEDVDAMLNGIAANLDALHKLNEAIPDPQLSRAMDRMEKAGRSIAAVVEKTPDKARSVDRFARSCFNYALDVKQDLWFGAKDTISKKYDHTFKDIFQETYDAEYKEKFEAAGITYFYSLIDDIVARVIRSEGGFVWACKNYDGDVMSDMVSTAFGSLAMMTSVLVSPDGKYEYEAAHGTVTRHYYKYLKGEKTSTNPMATIFAWSGAFKKRGELDNLPELVHFGEALEAASLQTLNEGIMTKDLCGLAEGITPTAVDSEGFIKAIRERLEAKLA